MITDKNAIPLTRLFGIYVIAGIGVVLCVLLYTLCSKQQITVFHESPVVYLIQGTIFLGVAFWGLSTIKVDFRAALYNANANVKSDVKLALRYFVIYAVAISAALFLIGLICLFLIKTKIISLSDFTAYFNKPEAIGENQRYFHDILMKSPFKLVVYFFSTCILIPIEEEIFFRRFLYVSLRHKMPFLLSLLVSSFIFSAVHLSGAVPALAAGLFLGWIYEKHQNLPANIMVHGLVNFSVTLFTIFLSVK